MNVVANEPVLISPDVEQFLASSPIGLVIVEEATGRRLMVNDPALAMFGARDETEFLSFRISDSWADQERLNEAREILNAGCNLENFEARRLRPDGSSWWVLMNSQRVMFRGKSARAMWHDDITARKLAQEQALDETQNLTNLVKQETEKRNISEANLIAVLEKSPIGVSVVRINPDDPIKKRERLFVNEALVRMFGAETPDDLLNQEISDTWVDPRALEVFEEKLASNEEVTGFEARRKRIDGALWWVALDTRPIIFDGIQCSAIWHHDVSGQKASELARMEALLEAEQASRAKTEFLANMSHELRTPLNAILGFSDILKSQLFGALGSKTYVDYAESIHKSGRHLLDLISDILDISAIEAGKRELQIDELHLSDVLTECEETVGQFASQNGVSLVLPTDELPVLKADRRAVLQILLNLLSNAIKYTEKGGKVSVEVEPQGHLVAISVSDTGVGISEEDLVGITNPFVKASGGALTTHLGTGLGLSIVESLVELHAGFLRIKSAEGEGTTATVTLPTA